jgi:hypothetical protein
LHFSTVEAAIDAANEQRPCKLGVSRSDDQAGAAPRIIVSAIADDKHAGGCDGAL